MSHVFERRRFELGPTVWTLLFAILAFIVGGSAVHGFVNGVGATIFVVLLGWLIAFWRVGVLALIALSCVDGFIKLIHQSPSTFVLKDFTLVALVIGLSAALALDRKMRPTGSWGVMWPLIFYVSFEAIQIFNPGGQRAAEIAGFRAHVLFATLFFIGVVYFDSPQRVRRTLLFAVGAMAFAAAVGIVQFFLGTLWFNLGTAFAVNSRHYVSALPIGSVLPGQPAVVYRSYGTLVDPTALGLACSAGIIYATALLVRAKRFGRLALIAAVFIFVVALIFSGTRSAMLGAGVGMLALMVMLALQPATRKFVFVAIALVALAVPLAFKLANGSAEQRLTGDSTNYAAQTRERSAGRIFVALSVTPFGVGLGATGAGGKYRERQRGTTLAVDDLYLAVLYETGPLGLFAFLMAYLALLIAAIRRAFRTKVQSLAVLYMGIAATQIGLMTSAFLTQGAFDYAPLAQVFWLFASTVVLPKRVEGTA